MFQLEKTYNHLDFPSHFKNIEAYGHKVDLILHSGFKPLVLYSLDYIPLLNSSGFLDFIIACLTFKKSNYQYKKPGMQLTLVYFFICCLAMIISSPWCFQKLVKVTSDLCIVKSLVNSHSLSSLTCHQYWT